MSAPAMSLPEELLVRPGILNGQDEAVAAARAVAPRLAALAPDSDEEGAFPTAAFALLAQAGLLPVALLPARGGLGLGLVPGTSAALHQVLAAIGQGNLSVGRVYEGHVNALHLVQTYGTAKQIAKAATDVHDHALLFGVWNTEASGGIHVAPTEGGLLLSGAKTFTSGAGHVARALITGALSDGEGAAVGWQMCLVPMDEVHPSIDPSFWRPLGMRASASYRVDFDGVALREDDLIGAPGDYYRQPLFSGGAMRFAAVQLGGAQALFDHLRAFLRDLSRTDDPYQRLRVGEVACLVESGALWLEGGARVADAWLASPGEEESTHFVAYANLMRSAIEKICLETMTLVERSVGARGLLRPLPFERIHRDLTLYLRQPAVDAALAGGGVYVLGQTAPAATLWRSTATDALSRP